MCVFLPAQLSICSSLSIMQIHFFFSGTDKKNKSKNQPHNGRIIVARANSSCEETETVAAIIINNNMKLSEDDRGPSERLLDKSAANSWKSPAFRCARGAKVGSKS
jgi:hypothetical protein